MAENIKDFLNEIDELKEYRNLGTVEEIQKMKKEEDILKFYYCESEDEYYIGKRIDTMYYAKYSKTGFVWCMSRYLPWGEHVVEPNTLWKEHTYPSEPKEIPFFEWLQGFIKKECLGTVEECREAREGQRAKKPEHFYKKYGKHQWRRKENGEIDDFAWDFGYHNGVACEICGETVCVHCNPDYDELDDCEEEHWNCPNCGKMVGWKSKYCDCGQAIDWSDTD